MPEMQLHTPVLFLIFNRPDSTQVVFNEIRKVKPKQLFIAADGPRKNHQEDNVLCQKTRAIIDKVDWDCTVTTLFRNENLGCKYAVSSAIDWFFSNVEEGIILEDDCVPNQSFFPFCQELLEKYRDDARIMMISGNNFQFGRNRTQFSYYFSRYFHIWGWATWKRAWDHYDIKMELWPKIKKDGWLNDILQDTNAEKKWEMIFDDTYKNKINTWDYQWAFSCWIQGGLSILPNQNLVSNIGFDVMGTHTKGDSIFSKLPTKNIKFPLMHPYYVIRDLKSDKYSEKVWFSTSGSLKSLLKSRFNLWMNK
jgi:hypothetical protein